VWKEGLVIDRRSLLGAGTLLGALIAPGDAAASAAGQNERDVHDIADAIKSLRTTIAAEHDTADIAPLRRRQLDFRKFPDFIEVSSDVWFAVYDWHVRNLQPLTLGRDGNGRYTIMLLFTTIVMRPDAVPDFISAAYDLR
jgi:hypothetical protein